MGVAPTPISITILLVTFIGRHTLLVNNNNTRKSVIVELPYILGNVISFTAAPVPRGLYGRRVTNFLLFLMLGNEYSHSPLAIYQPSCDIFDPDGVSKVN